MFIVFTCVSEENIRRRNNGTELAKVREGATRRAASGQLQDYTTTSVG